MPRRPKPTKLTLLDNQWSLTVACIQLEVQETSICQLPNFAAEALSGTDQDRPACANP